MHDAPGLFWTRELRELPPPGATPWKISPSDGKANRTSLDFTSDPLTEISAFFRKSGKVIIPLTVREILDEEIAMKLS